MTYQEIKAVENRLQRDLADFKKIHTEDRNRAGRYDMLASELILLSRKHRADLASAMLDAAQIAFIRGIRYARAADQAKRRAQTQRREIAA